MQSRIDLDQAWFAPSAHRQQGWGKNHWETDDATAAETIQNFSHKLHPAAPILVSTASSV